MNRSKEDLPPTSKQDEANSAPELTPKPSEASPRPALRQWLSEMLKRRMELERNPARRRELTKKLF